MNYTLKYILFILTVFTFVGCKPDEVEDTLALSIASISASDNAADYNVQVTTTAKEFSATSDSEWCTATLQPTTSSVKITVLKNRISTSRKARITITAGKKTAVVTVNQGASVYTDTNRDSVALLTLNNGSLKWNALQNMETWEGVKVDYINGVRRVIELNIPQKAYLTASVSDSIKNLTELRYIDLSGLNTTGNLPALSSLSKLVVLDLKNNKLTGAIPTLPTSLAYLSLGQNNFNGALPSQIKDLTKLVVLDLGLNDMTGVIPTEWSALVNLKYLYLYGNVLSGSIPTFITTFSKLEALALDYNQLTGIIPVGLGNMANLSKLTLQQNKLTGEVPADLVNNTNWITWSATVINQQNGVVLIQPAIGNKIFHKKTKADWNKTIYSLPNKNNFYQY